MGIPRLLQILLLAVPLMVSAGPDGSKESGAIYKIVGPDGQVTFSDTPPVDRQAEKVELAPINIQPITLPRPLPMRKLSPKADSGAGAGLGPVSIRIVSPQDGATIPPGQRLVALQVDVQPIYPDGARFFAVIDGQPWRGSSSGSALDLSMLERGSHSVQVVLTDANGRVLAQSPAITLYVQRPSVNLPAR